MRKFQLPPDHDIVLKHYHPYTQFTRTDSFIASDDWRIATFSAHLTYLIIVPYKYSYLLTYW